MKTPLVTLALAAGLCAAPCLWAQDPATPPAPAGPKLSWIDESDNDAAVAEMRGVGDRTIDKIGGLMIAEVRRVLATKGLEEAVEIMHLRTLEPPKPVPGKPQVTAIRRTSLRLRNPANAPDTADRAALDYIRNELQEGNSPPRILMQKVEFPGQPVEYRVYKPIAVMPDCLLCHGSVESQQPAVKDSLVRQFPEDKAIDYNAYDWRGVIRVSLRPPAEPAAVAATAK
jgi:hypothetical protein